MACVLTMFSALPAASSASARSKAAIAPFMSMRRTTSASVIQRLTAPPPGLLSCPLHGPSSRHRQETVSLEPNGSRAGSRPSLSASRYFYINQGGWQTIPGSSPRGTLRPRGPIIPRARQRTGRQVDGRGELGLARCERTKASQRQRAHLVFGVLAHGDRAENQLPHVAP